MSFRRSTWIFVATSFVLWLFLFWPFLVGTSCFGFRDSAHLYFPLFEWIQEQWSGGEIPLWNPLDDFGQPLAADGISSIFYPPKAIFFLGALAYPVRFALYVSIHALIAAWGTFYLARSLRFSPAGSALAAAGFALSGAVLFQTSNVVYFVGAAWLPWALACGWRAIRMPIFRHAAWCAVSIAFMILGGDPQTAYHVLLILAAGAVFATCRARRVKLGLVRFAPLARWMTIAAIAAGVAAIQWIPSWQWQQRSVRANPETPRSVWESIEHGSSSKGLQAGKWFSNPISDSHHDHIYQFSQPPWSLIELIWPNVSGEAFPSFRRWASIIPAADRIWTPSLYFGLVIFVLAICGTRLWGSSIFVVRLTWLTIAFGLGSFGWYGIGWLCSEIFGMSPSTGGERFAAPVFGVYWWMVTLLPGYAMFRYPAKLFVVATLGGCLLAGHQLTRFNPTHSKIFLRLALAILFVSFALLGASYLPGLRVLFSRIEPDPTFGPFDVTSALFDLRMAFAHSIVVSGLTFTTLRLGKVMLWRKGSTVTCILILAVVDLTMANSRLLVGVPASVLAGNGANATFKVGQFQPGWTRARRFPMTEGQPRDWAETTSSRRLEEVVQFERGTLHPKYHLLDDIDLIGSFHAIEPLDLKWFWQVVGTERDPLLGIDFQIHSPLPRLNSIGDPIVPHEIVQIEPVVGSSRGVFIDDWTPPAFSRVTRLRADQNREFAAAVEADLQVLAVHEGAYGHVMDSENQTKEVASISIVNDKPNEVDLHVDSPSAGWLVLKDYWDAGWRVEIRNRRTGASTTTLPERFCGILRAVRIPAAGEFDVRFVYRPISFTWGAAVTAATLLSIMAIGLARVGVRTSEHHKTSRSSPLN